MAETVEDAKTRSLRRWMWGLIALSFVGMVAGGGTLEIAPDLLSDVVSKLIGVAVVAGIVAYFFAGGESAYRKARGSWFGALVLLLGIAPALFVAQRMEQKREGARIVEIVNALAADVKKADNVVAERMKTAVTAKSRGVIGSPAMLDAAARKDARAELAVAIKVIDEGLAGRARLMQDAVANIEATRAAAKLKQSAAADLRAVAAKEPVAVQMLKAMRAFLAKAEEIAAFVEANAAGIEVRDGAIAIADLKLLERYQALEAALVTAQEAVRSLKPL